MAKLNPYRVLIDGTEHTLMLTAETARRRGAVPAGSAKQPEELNRQAHFPTAREQEELAVRRASDDAARSLAAKPTAPATVVDQTPADLTADTPAAQSVAPTQEINAAAAAEEATVAAEPAAKDAPAPEAKQAPAAPQADQEALAAAKQRRTQNKSRSPQNK